MCTRIQSIVLNSIEFQQDICYRQFLLCIVELTEIVDWINKIIRSLINTYRSIIVCDNDIVLLVVTYPTYISILPCYVTKY